MNNTLLNPTSTPTMATNNPQSNVNNVNQVGNNQMTPQIPQTNNQNGQNSQNNQINPITVPIQIQPIVPTNTNTNAQPNTNLQVTNNQAQQSNTNTANNIQPINNTVDFNQIYDQYQQRMGNSTTQQTTSGVKRTSFNTTIVTPTVQNLNTVEGQYQSAYADTVNGLIGSMMEQLNSLKDGSFYDPTQDSALKLASEYAANSTLQSLAGSGVLNSSATSERIARIVSELIPQYENLAYERQLNYLSQLANTAQLVMNYDSQQFQYWKDAKDREFEEKQFDYQKQQDAITNAWKRVDELGYVDNNASTVLGVPVGTLSGEARLAKEQREFELQKMREQLAIQRANDEALYRLKNELDLQSGKQLADYQSQLNRQELDYKAQLSKEEAKYQSQLSKEEAKYKSQLNKEETENNYKLQQQYGTASSSNSKTVSLSTYKDIINNQYTTYDEITGKRSVSSNIDLYNYLTSEYAAGRLSEADLRSLTAMYNVTQPSEQEIARQKRIEYLLSLQGGK